jgi:hypothetical protein
MYLQCLLEPTSQQQTKKSNAITQVDVIDRVQLQEIEFASSNITDVNTFVRVHILQRPSKTIQVFLTGCNARISQQFTACAPRGELKTVQFGVEDCYFIKI